MVRDGVGRLATAVDYRGSVRLSCRRVRLGGFGWRGVRGLLAGLHFLRLRGVLLLQLLCLLLMALLDLLFLCFAGVALGHLLMFFVLLRRELLVILRLFGDQSVLLLLVFLVGPGVAGVRRGGFVGFEVAGM